MGFFVFLFKPSYLFLVPLFVGPVFFLFWVVFNIAYFKMISHDHRALYYASSPVLSAVLPIAAGLLATKYSMNAVFFVGALFFLFAAVAAITLKNSTINYRFKDAFKSVKGVRTLCFVQGFWEVTAVIAIPLVTLYFIRNELAFGAFLSYLGIFGIIAALVMAKMSDKSKKRTLFIYPLVVVLAILTTSLFFARSFWLWGVFLGLFYFVMQMANPFFVTVVLDRAKHDIANSMIAREFMLNLGRFFGTAVLLFCVSVLNEEYAFFFVSGVALLFYPAILYFKRLYSEKANL